MKIIINPTRMEFLRLKRRLEMARRGHKLLKDKLDGLIQKFFINLKEYERLTTELEPSLIRIFTKMTVVSSLMSKEFLSEALMFPKTISSLKVSTVNMMGVRSPKYELITQGEGIAYGFATTSGELDQVILAMREVLPELVELGSYIKALELLSYEIANVKRRVNALEYVLIPELESSLKFIRMKLSEMERSYITSLMKIKDIVRAR